MDDVFGMSIEVATIVVPTAATLIVFILGYFLNLTIAWIKSRLAKRKIRLSVKAWIEIVKVPLQQDIIELRKIADESRKNEVLQQPQMEWVPLLGPKIENSITHNVMKVLLKRRYTKKSREEQQKLIYNIVSRTHFLTEIEEQIKGQYKRYESESLKLGNQWNELYLKMTEIINDLITNNKIQGLQNANAINNIIIGHNNAISNNPYNFKIAYESLIPQLKDINDLNCNQLLNLLPKAELIHTQWVANNNGFGKIFDDYADSLKNTLEKIDNIQKQL